MRSLAFLGAAAFVPALPETLPVGLAVETSLLEWVLRLSALAISLLLLAAGRRFHRLAMGALALLFGTSLGLLLLGKWSLAAGLFAGWLFFGFAMALYTFAPRLAVAVACLWPLSALAVAHGWMAGAFDRNFALPLGLAVAGALLGASLPRSGVALASAGTGTILACLALPWELPFWAIAVLGSFSFLWQVGGLPLFFQEHSSWLEDRSFEAKRMRWLATTRVGALSLVALATTTALLIPRAEGPGGPGPRATALRAEGVWEWPVLLFAAADSACLGGPPVRPSLAGGTGRVWDRLALPLLGRLKPDSFDRSRSLKTPEELARMRKAAAITSTAFDAASTAIRPGANESEVETAILEAFRKGGATGLAFPCIVGSGTNATLPHYDANCAVMDRGLVVVDIGCTVEGYASDMTRTFPVKGVYTPQERELLQAVVAAGDAARALLKAGVSYSEMDRAARESLKKAGLGEFILHGLGHGVGLDVHDPLPDKLEAGMVLTIEPGVYIPAGSSKPEEYWDLGVRIEDSYLVTETGYEELTSFPKIPPERGPAPTP